MTLVGVPLVRVAASYWAWVVAEQKLQPAWDERVHCDGEVVVALENGKGLPALGMLLQAELQDALEQCGELASVGCLGSEASVSSRIFEPEA